jgi:RNA polymerase sigma-70 factor (ECF subfamily)
MPPDDASHQQRAAEAADDGALMRGIAASDPRAMERLYDRYSSRVFAFCLRSLGDASEAEDLVVEIFWELWRRQDRYDATRSSPLTYLMKVTRSRLVDRLRSLRARSSGLPFSANPQLPSEDLRASESPAPIDQMAEAEAGDRLRAAMNLLNPDQRKALEMAYFDAMTYSEVADSLGQPLGTVKSRIRQALAQLRQMLERAGL